MRRPLLVLALAGAVLTACGDDAASTGEIPEVDTPPSAGAPAATAPAATATSAAADTPDTTTEAAPAPEALQFTAPLVGGGSLDFTQFAGRTVALWFWAPT